MGYFCNWNYVPLRRDSMRSRRQCGVFLTGPVGMGCGALVFTGGMIGRFLRGMPFYGGGESLARIMRVPMRLSRGRLLSPYTGYGGCFDDSQRFSSVFSYSPYYFGGPGFRNTDRAELLR